MFKKVVRLGVMVLVFTLLAGCLTACPRQIYSEEHKTIEELESELEALNSQFESMNERETTPSSKESIKTTPKPTTNYDLTIWSYTSEIQTLAIAFSEAQPEVNIEYVQISLTDSEYQNRVIASANADDCPDVIVLEAAFIRQFVESEMLLDLSDLKPYADSLQTYTNTIEMGTNFETGEILAYSYQNTAGTVFYRRSLAEDYFGTDSPEEIQAMMSDMDKFTDMAKTVNEKSDGKTFMVASFEEVIHGILANREQPWFVDDMLVIDPIVDDYFDFARVFRDNGYDAGQNQWSQGWFNGMNDSLTDANGDPAQIFCYFLPTWGLPYVLSTNGADTSGDWACCPGPLPYQWGGTWLGVMENASNPDLAKEFVRFCALDEQNLKNWATGVYTNEYLMEISPDLADYSYYLEQPSGDFVSSQKVVEAITAVFDNTELSQYLGGQNYYEAFALAAENCRADMYREYDDAIQYDLLDAVRQYAAGELTKDEALDLFKENAEASYQE